jgi:hypothetical protein
MERFTNPLIQSLLVLVSGFLWHLRHYIDQPLPRYKRPESGGKACSVYAVIDAWVDKVIKFVNSL